VIDIGRDDSDVKQAATGDARAGRAGWACLGPAKAGDGGAVCLLRVAVVPNARRTTADGLFDGALRVRLCAPPVEGRANASLASWIAAELGLPGRAVRIQRGERSRRKLLLIQAPVAAVAAWLDRVAGESAPEREPQR